MSLSTVTHYAVNILHLHTHERKLFRTVPGVTIASEYAVIKCKKELSLHGAETKMFINSSSQTHIDGAYVTDPLTLIRVVSSSSNFLIIGADTGGGITKIGVSTMLHDRITFTPLCVYADKDANLTLSIIHSRMHLSGASLSLVSSSSSAASRSPSLFNVFQFIINSATSNVYINGDWMWLCAAFGLKGPQSTHPCPICNINKKNLLNLGVSTHAVNHPGGVYL